VQAGKGNWVSGCKKSSPFDDDVEEGDGARCMPKPGSVGGSMWRSPYVGKRGSTTILYHFLKKGTVEN